MRLHVFFSIHERLFHDVCELLRERGLASSITGFVWSGDQEAYLHNVGDYASFDRFTRDVMEALPSGAPDYAYLESCEDRYGVAINRMIFSERHLLETYGFEAVLKIVARTFEVVERRYEQTAPDWIFSEDVSCLTSYIHWVVAQKLGIPYLVVANARVAGRLSVYLNQNQRWERTDDAFAELSERGLTAAERSEAEDFLAAIRDTMQHPPGVFLRGRLKAADKSDVGRFWSALTAYRKEPLNPVAKSPRWVLKQRAQRVVNDYATRDLFEKPVPGERYVLFPIHFQPEASTLVRGPYYLDQASLIEDIAKSLPVGYRLYVKEHMANRGRRTASFYHRIKNTFGVRLIGREENTWQILQNAAAVAVITGTLGWQGLIWHKPVITFGEVFYNTVPMVYRAGLVAKDQWFDVFKEALNEHQPNEEALLTYLYAVKSTTYPGTFANSVKQPKVREPENVKLIANALASAHAYFTRQRRRATPAHAAGIDDA